MSITFQTVGLEPAVDKLLRASDRKLIHQGVLRASHALQREAKITAGFAIRNGQFILGRTIVVVDNPGTLSADVGPTWIGGRLTELGGIVRPIHKKWLSWWVTPGKQKGGLKGNIGWASRRVFAKRTVHKPHPFLRPAMYAARDLMRSAMLEPLRRIFGQSTDTLGGDFEVAPK